MSTTNNDSHLPPLTTNGVFSVSATTIIDAPREKVWSILTEFASYNEWNSFVRGQVIVDKSRNILPDQTPSEGQYLYISPVHIPPTMETPPFPSSLFKVSHAFEIITTFDHANYRLAWRNLTAPGFLLGAERWQALSVVESEDGGPEKTKYETIEVFSGPLAYIVKFFLKTGLDAGFEAMGQELKKRAEQ